MWWYGGTIAEAVSLSKQRNAIFVVFIEGEDQMSRDMSAILDDSTISKTLSDEQNFLAIKLKSNTQHYLSFAQLYQFVPVPSLFFIGRNGTPLEVVCAGIQPLNLYGRIKRILEEHRKEPVPPIQPSTSTSNVKSESTKLIESEANPNQSEPHAPKKDIVTIKPVVTGDTHHKGSSQVRPASSDNVLHVTEEMKKGEVRAREDEEPESSLGHVSKVQKTHHEVTKSGVEYEVVCKDDVCVRLPKSSQEPGTSSSQDNEGTRTPSSSELNPVDSDSSSVDINQKMEKAKELIEARRREKAEKEKELEKQRELERRVTGQGVAELKRWQDEQEMKQLQKERKREKMESNLARQRVLEQIAQDRAERRAREVTHVQPVVVNQTTPTAGDVGSHARIQFKLPSGESHTAHFSADGTLADVRRYLVDTLQLTANSFTLWTAFPRRELTDECSSLRGLSLAPSAALLVLPVRGSVVAGPNGLAGVIAFVSHLLVTMIVEPATQVWGWIRGRVFGPERPPSRNERSPPRGERTPRPDNEPRPQPPTIRYRPRSNIHRLTGDKSQDDENNTWNGNSTQQM